MKNKSALGGRPKSEYEKKAVGIVEVVTGDRAARFTFVEEGKKFKNGTDTFKCQIADLPKIAQRVIKPGMKEPKQFRIRMNQEGDAIEAVTPVRGLVPMILVDLGRRESEDADPAPYERVFGEGTDKENRHDEFFAVYEVTEGPFKGVQLPAYYLHYKFEEDPDDEGFTRFAGNLENKKATRLHQLYNWGTLHKMYDTPIRWPDDGNILPELLERGLDSAVAVNGVLENGYITSIQLPEDYEQVDANNDEPVAPVSKGGAKKNVADVTEKDLDDEFPEPAPAKKTSKRPPKTSDEDDDL